MTSRDERLLRAAGFIAGLLFACVLGAQACALDFNALFAGPGPASVDAREHDASEDADASANADSSTIEASCARDASCKETCDKGPACTFECSGCTTDYHCQGSATSCNVACSDGSDCKVTCDFPGSCFVQCETGSQCLLSCTAKVPAGECTMDCAGGAPTTCPGPAKVLACNRPCM